MQSGQCPLAAGNSTSFSHRCGTSRESRRQRGDSRATKSHTTRHRRWLRPVGHGRQELRHGDAAPRLGGTELDDPQTTPYLVEAGPFPITLADRDNQLAAGGLTCVPDGATLEPNVVRGVFLILRPLSPGPHTIQIRGVAGPPEAPVFVKDVTYQIEVVRR